MAKASLQPLFKGYQPIEGTFDELFAKLDQPRRESRSFVRQVDRIGSQELLSRQKLASKVLLKGGITFAVYSGKKTTERIFPFDILPRIVSAEDWVAVDKGLKQRVAALNQFLLDVYGDRRIIKEKVIPQDVIDGSKAYLPKMKGIRPPGGVHVQISGIDLIRDGEGRFLVLEDNVRTPSGVSYVLENRAVIRRVLEPIKAKIPVRTVDEYPKKLREALYSLSPEPDGPKMVVLTPGPFNSAYFEHSFLARRMGCNLVFPSDLFVHQDRLFVKTTQGPQRVDVVYRRIDDEFLDPEVFRKDSLLGVPGITRAYAKGKVTLANAIGNGVADDKAVYPYVPDMIRFYLSEEPILGQVETYLCHRKKDLSHVLANLSKLVVKEVNSSGGYGMLMGHSASQKELKSFAEKIKKDPRNYIAQPLVELSTCPTMVGKKVLPLRVDLRPFVVTGRFSWVLPGGLTRVAMGEGNYVVNSSQGGGSKDTWVLEDEA